MPNRTRTLRLLAAPLVALLVLSGCGSSGSESGSGSGSGSSSDSSSTEPASKQLTSKDFGQRVLAAFQDAGTVQFTLQQEAGGQTVTGTGEGDLSGDQIRSRVQMKTPQGPVEVIAVDGLFYLKLPQVPGGKFLKVDPKDKTGLGALIGQLGGNSDPSATVKVFQSASEVTAEGTEDVDGTETTRYRVSLPREAVATSLGASEQLTALLPKTIAYQVWVDGDDLIRKLVSTIEVQNQSSTTTVTYTGFGEPVDIQAPPAAQVTDQLPGMSG